MNSWVFTFCLYYIDIYSNPYPNLQGRAWEKKVFSLEVWTMRVKCYTKYFLQFYQKQTFWEEENNPKTSIIWYEKYFMMVRQKLNNVINGYNLFFLFSSFIYFQKLAYGFNSFNGFICLTSKVSFSCK